MTMGPVQLLVVGLAADESEGEILAELDRLRANDLVRLIDLLVVRKDADGTVEKLRPSDLSPEEAEALGAIVGALIGIGEDGAELGAGEATALDDGQVLDDEVWFVDDAIPSGTAAVVALLEHRWAIPLRDGIRRAGGFHLADAWIHPADLVDIGILAAEDVELHLAQA